MKSSELLKLLKKDGWFAIRQTGSHIIMKHTIKKNRVVILYHSNKEMKNGTLNSILKEAEIKTAKR